jgi:hypothetical protein
MAFPLSVFPHPSTNDAIGLADAEWPLLLVEIAGAVVAYVVFRGERGALIRAGIGVLLLGGAIVLVVGLLAFGNLSNDRFAPLLFFPPVIGLAGLAGLVVAVAAGFRYRDWLLRGARYGLGLALGFAGWTLVRGARAWLQAPYGFDLLLLLGVFGVGIVVLGTSPNVKRAAPPG